MSSEYSWSEPLPATPEIQEITDKVKPQLEKKEDKAYPVYKAIMYRRKVLCGGTHYLIKVSVSDSADECVHLYVVIVIIAPPWNPNLNKYQLHKTKDDPLEPF